MGIAICTIEKKGAATEKEFGKFSSLTEVAPGA